mmetsp:Transcript_20293/g.42908  ORF Transcript_20293/g.42908 Transcript_20293/m.42908 type:complete len:261 (+) Transcript_20293:652-1434(+)
MLPSAGVGVALLLLLLPLPFPLFTFTPRDPSAVPLLPTRRCDCDCEPRLATDPVEAALPLPPPLVGTPRDMPLRPEIMSRLPPAADDDPLLEESPPRPPEAPPDCCCCCCCWCCCCWWCCCCCWCCRPVPSSFLPPCPDWNRKRQRHRQRREPATPALLPMRRKRGAWERWRDHPPWTIQNPAWTCRIDAMRCDAMCCDVLRCDVLQFNSMRVNYRVFGLDWIGSKRNEKHACRLFRRCVLSRLVRKERFSFRVMRTVKI